MAKTLQAAARDLARTADEYDVTLRHVAYLADEAVGANDLELFEFLAREYHDLRACRLRDVGDIGSVGVE